MASHGKPPTLNPNPAARRPLFYSSFPLNRSDNFFKGNPSGNSIIFHIKIVDFKGEIMGENPLFFTLEIVHFKRVVLGGNPLVFSV